MASGLTPFCHNRIRPVPLHAPCQCHGSHHGNHLHACCFPYVHILLRIPGAGGNHLNAFLHNHLSHIIRIRAHQHHIDPKRLVRKLPCLANLIPDHFPRRIGPADKPQAPGLRNRRRQMMFRNPGHTSLDNGVLHPQKLCNSCLHFTQRLFPSDNS